MNEYVFVHLCVCVCVSVCVCVCVCVCVVHVHLLHGVSDAIFVCCVPPVSILKSVIVQ